MKLITRTISEKSYDVMTLNIKTAQVSINTYSMGSLEFKGKDSAIKALQQRYNTEDVRLVEIVKVTSHDALYAMTEECFLKNAIAVADIKEARAYFKSNPEDVEEVTAE